MSSSLKLSNFPRRSHFSLVPPPSISAFLFGGVPIYRTSILLHLPLNSLPPLDLLLRFAFVFPNAISPSSISSPAAVSATCLFFSAIPALLAFKKAAESLEKLMDTAREELPDTMAAIRLSGMEIGDLTMELSDIGQEITQGVRSSAKAVRLAEQRLRQFQGIEPPAASLQMVATQKCKTAEPVVARNARAIREGIVKGRGAVQLFFTLTRFSMMAVNYFKRRSKQQKV